LIEWIDSRQHIILSELEDLYAEFISNLR
jgi:hypothetical protein